MMTSRRSFLQQNVTILAGLGLLVSGCQSNRDRASKIPSTQATRSMFLESSAFMPSGLIPVKYTCDGNNISPALRWHDPPAGTQSFNLIVIDPDAPGQAFVHWLIYNLPADLRQLPEGIPSQPELPQGGLQGQNDFEQLGYGGPCPPRDDAPHHYVFQLYALDTVLSLKSGATQPQVLAAMQGHILAIGELVGLYDRSKQKG